MKKILLAVVFCFVAFTSFSRRPVGKISFKSDAQKKLELKLKTLKVDKIEFADEEVLVVFKYLRLLSKKVDPTGRGVNFVFKNLDKNRQRITIILEDVPMLYAIKSICETSGLTYRIDDYAVFIIYSEKKKR